MTNEVRRQAQEWRRELGVPGDKLLVMFAGKFEPKKRPLDLLEAFSQSKFNNAVLIFVGSGELEAQLRRRANSVDNVLVAPFQNQSKMPRTYAACDLFVLPSYGEGETWGLAVNEAMALSCPIIVSEHVGCWQDLAHSRENGLIFPAGNVSELRDALRQALEDKERLRKWGETSRTIIANYSYHKATGGLETALEAILSSKT